ncbi:MAG: hypothetical protein ACREM3_29640, partial [Candidatus Rokuibacteriota bacterium]
MSTRRHGSAFVLVLAGILWAGPAPAQQIFAYPQKGLSPQQQQKDQAECHGWALQQSGYNPAMAAAPPPPPPPGGGAVGG